MESGRYRTELTTHSDEPAPGDGSQVVRTPLRPSEFRRRRTLPTPPPSLQPFDVSTLRSHLHSDLRGKHSKLTGAQERKSETMAANSCSSQADSRASVTDGEVSLRGRNYETESSS